MEVKTRGGVRWPESYVATSRQPLSTEWQIRGARCLSCLFATLSSLVRGKERKRKDEGRAGKREKMGAHPFFQPAASHSSIELELRVTHTPSSDLSITDPRIFFFYLFVLILSSRVRNWIARNKPAASYFGGARLDQGVPWTILLLFIWTIFRGGRSTVVRLRREYSWLCKLCETV